MDDLRAQRLFGETLVAPGDLALSPFRVDRDRIAGSPFFARLGGVTQVISPGGAGLLVHNRMTHSLKVAQGARAIAERVASAPASGSAPASASASASGSVPAFPDKSDLSEKLGGCDPDVVEA